MLPCEDKVVRKLFTDDSWFRQKDVLTEGAYSHPVLVLATHQRVQDIVFVAPMTSFRETTLNDKYKGAGS
jgi:hypothetical protein